MSIVIKEIHVKTVIEKNMKQELVSTETIQRIKFDILREMQKSKAVVQPKRGER